MKKTISILGDSYSTYTGYNREGYDIWYPNEPQGVMRVEETWWKKLCDDENLELIENNSYSGSTICNTGYDGMDSSFCSYITRIAKEMSKESIESDYFLIFGATNDFWSGAPIGKTKYLDWNKEDLKQFAPAFCYLINYVTKRYNKSKIYVIVNDILPDYFLNIMQEVCSHYHVEMIQLNGVEKIDGHPTVKGMKTIKEQIAKSINRSVYDKGK